MIKAGNVELTEAEAEKIYKEKRYIVTFSKIYAIRFRENAGYYAEEIYKNPVRSGVGFVRRGRFHAMVASDINHFLGFSLLQEV